MLVHELWSPGHLTVRTVRDRRLGHSVEVLRDGRRLAEGDDEGLLRATTGLVLAEALVVPAGPSAPTSPTSATSPTAPGSASSADRRVPPAAAPVATGPVALWGPAAPVDQEAATPASDRSAAHGGSGGGERSPRSVRSAPPLPHAGPDGRGRTGRPRPVDPVAAPSLVVDVFGVRQGEVVVRRAVEGWRLRVLEADLLVDGAVAARLLTLGPRAEDAVVVADGVELARLARFDHLRGTRYVRSAWDLTLAEIEDERLRAVTLAAIVGLPRLRAAVRAADHARRRAAGRSSRTRTGRPRRSRSLGP